MHLRYISLQLPSIGIDIHDCYIGLDFCLSLLIATPFR